MQKQIHYIAYASLVISIQYIVVFASLLVSIPVATVTMATDIVFRYSMSKFCCILEDFVESMVC